MTVLEAEWRRRERAREAEIAALKAEYLALEERAQQVEELVLVQQVAGAATPHLALSPARTAVPAPYCTVVLLASPTWEARSRLHAPTPRARRDMQEVLGRTPPGFVHQQVIG